MSSEQLNIEKSQKQMQELTEKKKSVLDAFFSQNITKDEMRMMNEKYDADISLTADKISAAKKKQSLSYSCHDIKADMRKSVENMLYCKDQQDNFYGSLLDKMVVYDNDRVEVSLNLLSTKWIYVIECLKDIQKKTGGGKKLHLIIEEKRMLTAEEWHIVNLLYLYRIHNVPWVGKGLIAIPCGKGGDDR